MWRNVGAEPTVLKLTPNSGKWAVYPSAPSPPMKGTFPRFQVATTWFSCNPPDLNLIVTNFIFVYI